VTHPAYVVIGAAATSLVCLVVDRFVARARPERGTEAVPLPDEPAIAAR